MGNDPNRPNIFSPATEVPISMYVPPLQPSNNFAPYISGKVTIDPTAAIAPGVLLQASPNSRIIIGAGACIGMGSVLHAYEGTLEVEAGANLGAGVLIVGKGKIGANACIGSTATILNYSIEPQQVVAAGSLIGDESRQVPAHSVGATNGLTSESAPSQILIAPSQTLAMATVNAQTSDPVIDANVMPTANANPPMNSESTETEAEAATETEAETADAIGSKVYGKGHLNRMISTMFPHRKSLSSPLNDGQSPSDKT